MTTESKPPKKQAADALERLTKELADAKAREREAVLSKQDNSLWDINDKLDAAEKALGEAVARANKIAEIARDHAYARLAADTARDEAVAERDRLRVEIERLTKELAEQKAEVQVLALPLPVAPV